MSTWRLSWHACTSIRCWPCLQLEQIPLPRVLSLRPALRKDRVDRKKTPTTYRLPHRHSLLSYLSSGEYEGHHWSDVTGCPRCPTSSNPSGIHALTPGWANMFQSVLQAFRPSIGVLLQARAHVAVCGRGTVLSSRAPCACTVHIWVELPRLDSVQPYLRYGT